MANNSKSKGSSWERDISKFLTLWLTEQNKEYYFWRTPGSGGIGSISPVNTDLHGDIIPLKPEADILCSKFCIECKTGYPNASIDFHLKSNKNDIIKDFWIQATEAAISSNKQPMLIFKKKGFSTPWLGITEKIYNKLKNYISTLRYVSIKWETEELDNLYLFELNDFFKNVTPKIIKTIKI
jgi:hypothetical protein